VIAYFRIYLIKHMREKTTSGKCSIQRALSRTILPHVRINFLIM